MKPVLILILSAGSALAQAPTFDQIVQDYQVCQTHHRAVNIPLSSNLGRQLGLASPMITTVTTDYEAGWEWCTAQEQAYHKALVAQMDAQHLNITPGDAATLARKSQY